MALQIATTQDVTLADLSKDKLFRSNVESSIAVGLGVDHVQVLVTKIEIDSRRLQADAEGSQGRHLQSAVLMVTYEVYVSGGVERNRINGSINPIFSKTFRNDLQSKEKASGRFVVVDSVKVESMEFVERTVSVEQAKLAAKKEAAATTTLATSTTTSKAPMTTAVTPAPTTKLPLIEVSADDEIAGSATAVAASGWISAVILHLGVALYHTSS